jgi:bifunctional non-homologous end joining protein LigD
MVHKHDASRLHYDLRLEMDGALASWAIPKGPSFDPLIKRLAVQTEDHPLEYGSFEGRIPDGEYGAGDSIIWDRGTYETVPPGQASLQRKKGHLHIELQGEKLQGRWHLVRTRGGAGGKEQWLCFKAKDGKENPSYDVVAERPESVLSGKRVTRGPVTKKSLERAHPLPAELLKRIWPPMRATLSEAGQVEESEYLFEVKYDGYRGVAALSSGMIAFQTRNALDLIERFPRIARALTRLYIGEAVIDGEVVAFDSSGVSHFQELLTEDTDHQFIAFDLLWLDGEDLRQRPLEERRDLLESLFANVSRPLQLAERLPGTRDHALAEAKRRGLEGLIAKRRGSPYTGTRSQDWLKVKLLAAQEVAILGFTPISHGGPELGALLVGIYGDGRYRYAGKVGTGYSSKVRKELRSLLEKDLIPEPVADDVPRMRGAFWVKPRWVAQVAFTEWTRDGKLRHPSFQGLREDKQPTECIREKPRISGARRAPRPKLAARTASEPVLLTHPDRLVYPESKITKAEVFRYYQEMAPFLLPALSGRPLALQQWPQGISAPGFFRQDVPHAPEWMNFVELEQGRTVKHLIADKPETLAWLANQSALTLHMFSSRVPHLDEPDWVVFDLDPVEGGFEALVKVARTLLGLLEHLGLDSVPKTSGKRGLHVLVPVARGHTYQDTLDFAVAIAQALESRLSDIATTERKISNRRKRLYLDAFQNAKGKTLVAPYTLRAIEGAPVSTPLRWSEVNDLLDPLKLNLKTIRKRLDKVGDLFLPALSGHQRLPRLKP